jgi:hypothetical protein
MGEGCSASAGSAGQGEGSGSGQGSGRGQKVASGKEASAKAAGGKNGSKGDPKGPGNANVAQKSKVSKGKPKSGELRDPAQDADAWGKVNDREVAKSLLDLWGKVPPSYRKTVIQYFKDISGLEPEPASPPSTPAPEKR